MQEEDPLHPGLLAPAIKSQDDHRKHVTLDGSVLAG